MSTYSKKFARKNMPDEFDERSVKTYQRIEENSNVIGTMYFRNSVLQLWTVPESMTPTLYTKLPRFTTATQQAIGEITASINRINPIVDRIVEDDSVEGVIMTNNEGIPILTNINIMGATNYGLAMKRLGDMTQIAAKEIDPFDEVLVLRLKTKKLEIMVAPNQEFYIIVLQHARDLKKMSKREKEKENSNSFKNK